MAVLLPNRFLYLAHTRVGSRATAALLESLGGESVDTGRSGGGTGHHAHFYNVVRHCDYQGEEVVCTVRNHFEALVTWWLSFNRKGHAEDGWTFERFVHELVANDRQFMTLREEGLYWFHRHMRWSDRVLRYERLHADINKLLFEYGLPTPSMPYVNVTPNRKATRSYFTPELRRKVEELFGSEMDLLEYGWSNIRD